jgi:RNA polymerase sigma factor (sigma-70 family)
MNADHNPGTPAASPDAAWMTALATDHPDQLLVSQLALIDDVVGFVARRHRLSPQDREDFGSIVRMRLIENDYRVLRQFRGHSSLRSYLVVVITRLVLDYRIAEWGKWRPSAEARRLGPLAMRLETLVCRDQMTIDAACELLEASNMPVTPSAAAAILNRLPVRSSRRFLGEPALEGLPAATPGPDAVMMRPERRRTTLALSAALAKLGSDDRRLLRLRFRDRVPVATIARRDGVDQKGLYRRIERLLAAIRPELERQGLDAERLGLRDLGTC